MGRPGEGGGALAGAAKETEKKEVPFGAVVEGVPGGEEVGKEDVIGWFELFLLPALRPLWGGGAYGEREGGKVGGEEADQEEEGLRGEDEGGGGGVEGGEEVLKEEEGGGGGVVVTESVESGEISRPEGVDQVLQGGREGGGGKRKEG